MVKKDQTSNEPLQWTAGSRCSFNRKALGPPPLSFVVSAIAVQKFVSAFQRIVSRVDQLKPDSKSECYFDCLAGGLIWTDERPTFRVNAEELGALRMLWNYRTSLLIGAPRSEFRELWNPASVLAPNWPGFRPERCTPSPELVEFLNTERKGSRRTLDRLDAAVSGRWKPLSGGKQNG